MLMMNSEFNLFIEINFNLKNFINLKDFTVIKNYYQFKNKQVYEKVIMCSFIIMLIMQVIRMANKDMIG